MGKAITEMGPYVGYDPEKDPYIQGAAKAANAIAYNPDMNIMQDLIRHADTTLRNLAALTAGLPGDIQPFTTLKDAKRQAPTSEELAETFGGDVEHPSWFPAAVIAPGPGELAAAGKTVLGAGKVIAASAPLAITTAIKDKVLPYVGTIYKDKRLFNYKNKTEYVHVDELIALRGNKVSDTHHYKNMEELKADIVKEGGLREPVTIQVGKNDRRAMVGEGNHRVQAAKELGYDYIPTRVWVQRNVGFSSFEGAGRSIKREDLLPKANEYFSADAKPSEVFTDLDIYNPNKLEETIELIDKY